MGMGAWSPNSELVVPSRPFDSTLGYVCALFLLHEDTRLTCELLTKALRVLGISQQAHPMVYTVVPRMLVQGTLAGWCDYSLAQLALQIGASPFTALLASTTNWFMFYCGVRTYSNSVEGCLFTIALSKWPIEYDRRANGDANVCLALLLASISIIVRPSAVVSWVYLGVRLCLDIGLADWAYLLWNIILKQVLPVAVTSVLILLIAVDYYFYQHELVFVIWNFFHFNVVKNLSSLYGVHAWHWYFSSCLPTILGTHLIPFAMDMSRPVADERKGRIRQRLIQLILLNLCILSLSPHKELRFAFPLVPLCLAIASRGLDRLLKEDFPRNAERIIVAWVVVNALPTLFLAFVHQSAPIRAALFLAHKAKDSVVDILLPCHTMPLHSHIGHAIKQVRFLDCSPHIEELRFVDKLNSSFTPHRLGVNDSAAFLMDPQQFLRDRYRDAQAPDFVVTQDPLLEQVLRSLPIPYTVCASFSWAQPQVHKIQVLCSS